MSTASGPERSEMKQILRRKNNSHCPRVHSCWCYDEEMLRFGSQNKFFAARDPLKLPCGVARSALVSCLKLVEVPHGMNGLLSALQMH